MRRSVLASTAVLLLIAGCGSSTSPDPRNLLQQAKHVFDATKSLHFSLTSENAPRTGAGTYLLSGTGDATRPDGVTGNVSASIAGLVVPVAIVGTGGRFWVRLPFETGWDLADPTKYGFGDPSQLLNPDHGLSSFLAIAQHPAVGANDRLKGEELNEVSAAIPGGAVARLLASADPTHDDTATFGINVSTHQLRRVTLTGPFLVKNTQSSYTVVLDNYDENVTVTPPA